MAKQKYEIDCCEKWKDRLLENINELVKKMHSEVCSLDGSTTSLSQNWAQVEEICTHLDQAFSYGLKRSLEGYWPFVKEITHKSVIEHILSMPTIMCNSEKELMWLLISVNDQTIESYLRSIMSDERLVRAHYLPFSLMGDHQRLQLLMVMMAGLEHIDFNLDLGDVHLARRIIDSIDHREVFDVTDSSSLNSSRSDLSIQTGSSPAVDDRILRLLSWDASPKPDHNTDDYENIIHSSSYRSPRNKPTNMDWTTGNILNVTAETHDTPKKPTLDTVDANRKEQALIDFINNSDQNHIIVNETEPNPDKTDTIIATDEQEISSTEEREAPEGQEDPMVSSAMSTSSKKVSWAPNVQEPSPRKRPVTTTKAKVKLSGGYLPKLSALDGAALRMTSQEETTVIAEEVAQGRKEMVVENTEGQITVDNNLLLFLMLEVFDGQEESFYKMFRTTVGHTTGTAKLTFVILTDKHIYLSHEGQRKQRFDVFAKVPYDRLDFLQLSINSHILQVVCAAPRRRFWLCTGCERSTCNLVASIEVAMRRSGVKPPCVLTDSVSHNITLQKWISEEMDCHLSDVTIQYYALVYWEDSQRSDASTDNPTGPYREGDLMFQYTDQTVEENPQWQPGYFILKAGVLYRLSDRLDKRVQSYLQLREGGCGGCRRLPISSIDRPHVIELILDGGRRMLRLAMSDESTASDWLSSFLHSASHQEMSNFVPDFSDTCKACSLVLTPKRLFVCQEELDTGVITGISSIGIADLVAITVDADTEAGPYCILEIESTEAVESLGDWALYFATCQELQKFSASLGAAWEILFKIPLNVRTLTQDKDNVERYRATFQQLWQKAT